MNANKVASRYTIEPTIYKYAIVSYKRRISRIIIDIYDTRIIEIFYRLTYFYSKRKTNNVKNRRRRIDDRSEKRIAYTFDTIRYLLYEIYRLLYIIFNDLYIYILS